MKKYNQNDLVIDYAQNGYPIIDPDVLERIITDANRYQFLKTADHGCLHWHGQDDGWMDVSFIEDWDESIDFSLQESTS